MNRAVLTGRIVRDVEVKTFKKSDGDESKYANFTLAVYRNMENTDFINCVAFGYSAERLETIGFKGNKIGVEGRIQSVKYEGKNGTVNTVEVYVDHIELCATPKNAPSGTTVQDTGYVDTDSAYNAKKGGRKSWR